MNISGSRVIHIVIVFVSSPSIDLIFIVHLKIISKLKAGSIPNVKVVSANADTILVAINKINRNINEGNWANQWEALQELLHMWLYDFYDIGYFTE